MIAAICLFAGMHDPPRPEDVWRFGAWPVEADYCPWVSAGRRRAWSHLCDVLDSRQHIGWYGREHLYAEAEADARARYEAWEALEDATVAGWPPERRADRLAELRRLIGPLRYWAGVMPPPNPRDGDWTGRSTDAIR